MCIAIDQQPPCLASTLPDTCELLLADQPEPWVFTFYKVLNGMLNFIVWFLLLAVVLLLMIMLVWFGAAMAINAAAEQGTRYAMHSL